MRALITGDAGFVGKNYKEFLKNLGWEVYGLDIVNHPDEDAFLFFAEDTEEHFDLLIHCAYEVGGRAHIDGSNMALAKNVAMDATMFQWALRGGSDAVIYFSSSAAYPKYLQVAEYNDRPLLYEDYINDYSNLVNPDANYGWAKLTGERIAKAASDQGLRVHVVRPFSGYGTDQALTYPFPSIIRRAMSGDLTVWGPPGQTRDWVHIEDVIRGTHTIYENDERRPVNVCTGVGTEMAELMIMARTIVTGCTTMAVNYQQDKPTGVFYRVGDPTRFNEHYIPKISIEEGVSRAIGSATKV